MFPIFVLLADLPFLDSPFLSPIKTKESIRTLIPHTSPKTPPRPYLLHPWPCNRYCLQTPSTVPTVAPGSESSWSPPALCTASCVVASADLRPCWEAAVRLTAKSFQVSLNNSENHWSESDTLEKSSGVLLSPLWNLAEEYKEYSKRGIFPLVLTWLRGFLSTQVTKPVEQFCLKIQTYIIDMK